MKLRKGAHPVIVLIGKDARTDALAYACARSSSCPRLFAICDYAHAGLQDRCDVVHVRDVKRVPDAVAFSREIQADLAIIGPEEPLAEGIVDALAEAGIRAFGPTQSLARIESSKGWARSLLAQHGVPGNPEFATFRARHGLREYLRDLGEFVVKPDGLTGGKGVRVSGEHFRDFDDGLRYAQDLIGLHGSVTVEEKLDGEEFSLQTITDGETVVHCPVVQDHKRAFIDDEGPNTGGMGSYSCADGTLPFLTAADVAAAQAINASVVDALHSETGQPYRGVLYGGFMATGRGIKVIEFNARFGDPEALNVLSVLQSDFVDLAFAVAEGTLRGTDVRFASRFSVCKYVVPDGYPQSPARDVEIREDPALVDAGCQRFFAGVRLEKGHLLLTGSRSVAFVGVADDLASAEALAERGTKSIKGAVTHRRDIGRAELVARRVEHMRALRGDSCCQREVGRLAKVGATRRC